MTPEGMVVLRRAAALVHGLPRIRVRLRRGSDVLLEVADHPAPSGRTMSPYAFRMEVSRAHRELDSAGSTSFLGMPPGFVPAVDIGVAAGDRALAGGIYRVSVGGSYVTAFTSTLPARRARELLDERGGTVNGDPVQLHHDAAIDMTLVHIVNDHGLVDGYRREELERLLAAFLADEVVQLVTAG